MITRARARRRGVAVLALTNVVAALGGAVGLATGTLALGDDLNERLPFASPVLGGIALAMIVAVPFAVSALAAWRGDPRADLATAVAGVVLIGWIVVQLAFLRSVSFFHPLYAAVGGLFVWLGRGAFARAVHARPRR
jgi:uncharacterized membrane protein